MEHFFQTLFGDALCPERQLAIFTLPDERSRHFSSLAAAALFANKEAQTKTVYFGVGLAGQRFGHRSAVADIAAIPGVWADIDCVAPHRADKALPKNLDEVRTLLARLPFPPTLLVDSGHGIHAYWLFKEPWLLDSDADRIAATRVTKGWHGLVCSHAAAMGWSLENLGDLSRLLRAPGMINRNCETPVEVRIIEEYLDRRYNPSDFEAFAIDELVNDKVATLALKLNPAAQPPFEKFATLLSSLPSFAQAWKKERPELNDQSQSAYDLSLANIAALNGWTDQEIADLIIAARRKHGDKPEKALRMDYMQRTISSARLAANERIAAGVDLSKFLLRAAPVESELIFAGEILTRYTTMRTPIIHGLLRDGEVMNVIAPPKTGKSWLTLTLALSVVTGKHWLGFKTEPGRVLILDNELHGETVGNRLPKVADSLGIPISAYSDQIAYRLLRGQLKDVYSLGPLLQSIQPGFFKIIVLDAFYRFLPKDTDENDNGSMAALYNQIDRYAGDLSCAFILIHHTSKGLQTGRAITDVGAGAGAISRAADCHLILCPHKEAGAIVLDATPRSWPPVPSCCLRFKHPLWTPAADLDPSELQSARSPKQKRDIAPPASTAASVAWTRKRFVAEFITNAGKPKPAILAAVEDRNDPELSRYRAEQFIETAEGAGDIFRWDNGAKKAPSFATVPQPELIKNEREGESGFALEVNSKATHPTPSLKHKKRKSKPKPNGDKVPA